MLDPKLMRQIGLYGAIGTEISTGIVGGILLGYFLDKHFGTAPILLLSGLILGSAVSVWRLVALQKRLSKDSQD